MSTVAELPGARWNGLVVAFAEWGLAGGHCALAVDDQPLWFGPLSEVASKRHLFGLANTLWVHESDLHIFRAKIAGSPVDERRPVV
ncbi:hypothetical protein [Burkholderia sp. Ac-20365]|uniref:hypothetical protein n=1 Tax=Burkholderia sp. Ac-20365 TaxID=2703897 RepID=UPI00197B69EE|nr:hypothetical protein [Burkholderia sp. Ac-20365]MBN3761370.1 hypothetical protein [Burkholderia sp. Ac-20365]